VGEGLETVEEWERGQVEVTSEEGDAVGSSGGGRGKGRKRFGGPVSFV